MSEFSSISAGERISCWWEAKSETALGEAIKRHIEDLHQRQAALRRRDAIYEAMYHNKHEFRGSRGARAAISLRHSGVDATRLNLVRSAIDAITSRVALNIPTVEVAADAAEWSYKLKAKRMTRFVTTKQEETGFRRIAPLCLRDSMIKGVGVTKTTHEDGEIVHDRVPRSELYVDELEGRYGSIRNIHQRKQYSRDVLCAMYPEKKHAILTAPDASSRDYEGRYEAFESSNLVDVFESIHTPSGKDVDNGVIVHSLCNGVVLSKKPWRRKRLPYSFVHWSPPTTGFWGTGLAEELVPIQDAIDETMETLHLGFRYGAPLRIFCHRSSRIVKTQLIARVGTIVEHSGPSPEIKAPSNPVSQQQISWLIQLIDWGYQVSGISQMAASGKKPASLESGRAIQMHHDFETERFQFAESGYQNYVLDVGERDIDEAKAIYGATDENGKKLHGDYHAKWLHRDVVEKINWSDVDLSRDSFKLKMKPVSYLRGTISERLDRAEKFAKAGLVPERWLLPLLDASDLERFIRLESANFNYAEWFVECCMDEDKRLPAPSPISDLKFLLKHTKAAALDCHVDGAPDSVLNRFDRALDMIRAAAEKAKPEPTEAMAQPMPGAGGPLPPGAAPTTMEGQAFPNAPMAVA